MVIGGFPNPAKTQCFSTLVAPAYFILAYAHRKSKDQQVENVTWSVGSDDFAVVC